MIYILVKYKFLLLHLVIVIFFIKNNIANSNYIRDTEIEFALESWSTPIFEAAKINPENITTQA